MLRFCYVLLIVESKRKVSFSQDSGVQSHVRPQIKISPIDEQFISQIVLTPTPLEQPLANVLRSVFTAGRAETFQDTLAAWSAKKEEEIEAVCGEGYGLFVPTVETVLGRIRETGNLLDEKVTHLREELSSSAQHIYDTRVERFEARKMQLNVGKAVHSIEDSLKALNLLLSIQLEISDGHDHSAVKLIDELQGKGALRAIEEMPFYGKVLKSLEQSKKKVWESATGQVKRWLSSVRDESSVMGGLALSQLQTRFEQFQRHSDNTRPFELFLSELAAEDSEIITSNDLVKVDFSPLQGSLRLFTMMDKRGELIELLIETRRVQLDLILSSRVCLEKPDTDPKSLRSFLNALTGFFIFERLLTRLPLSIYPLGHLESRWEAAQNKIREIALDSLRLSSSDRAAFMKIKWQLVFFTHALEMFGYPKNQLVDTILTLFYRYVDLLRQDSIEKCQSAIKKDTFTETATHPTGLDLEYPENALIDCVQVIQINFLSSFSIFLEGVPGCSNRTIDFSDLARRTVDDQILPAAGKELFAKIQAIVSENDVKSSMISTQLVQILKCIHDFEIITSDGGAVTRLLLSYNSNSKANNTSTPTGPCHKLNSNEVFHNLLKKSYSSAVNLIDEDLDRILQKLRYDRNPKSSPSPAIQGN